MAYKRILIWEQNWLGDVLFSTPFIRAIRKKFPDAYIACIVTPSCKEIIEANPGINEIILYDEKLMHRGIIGGVRILIELKKRNFDTAFLLHRSLSRAIIACLAGIKQRIGYFYRKRNLCLTEIIDLPEKPLHKIEYFLNIAAHIGADTSDKNLEFNISSIDRNYIDGILKENNIGKKDSFIVINPGANWPPKRWPEESFAELSDKLIEIYNIKIVISGAEADIVKGLHVQDRAKNALLILCGKTTLKQLGALFERAKIVISGDSGPLHIALAVGAKVIALFGPTSPGLTGPYGEGKYSIIRKDVGCEVPCYDASCNDSRCMKAISVEDIVQVVKRFI